MSFLEAGKTILHYRIVEPIGRGGMGEVYKAEDQKLGRLVAIKALSASAGADETARLRLIREARAASSLNHPNIVTVHSIDEVEGFTFIVMEYVAGESFSATLRREQLDFSTLIEIAIQICDAVAAAHSIGLVHRDLKPQNIVITPEGRVKVLDFGLAKVAKIHAGGDQTAMATMSVDLTAAGVISGTVTYMSPEQARGETPDPRSDVFSLGAVLYEAATRRQPFRGPSVLAIMHEIATADPPRPGSVRSDLPPEFDAILARALAKDKESRYANAAELGAALRQMQAGGADLLAGAGYGADVFVGRDPELRRMSEHLQRSLEGTGKVVFLTGEPGRGKTALAEEFLRRARRHNVSLLVARGRCVEQYGPGEAYLPFLDALSGLLEGAARDRILTVLRSHAPTWCLQLPAVFGSSGMLEQLQRETIGATRDRMVREMGDALGALSSVSPLALLLEDLHWADPSTIDLLRHICQRIGEQRLLVLGTFRPEELETGSHPLRKYSQEMKTHKQCEEIALSPLNRDQIAGYLDARFSPNTFPRDMPDLIERKTEGHPLFATSLIQFLTERGDILKVDGQWTLARRLSDMDLEAPESVRSMIRTKIDSLPEEDRRALQYASVEGEEFLSTVLAALLQTDELVLEEQLARLARVHQFIKLRGEEELPDGSLATRYRFSHALYQNLLYQDLVSKRKMLLHRQAGERLAGHYGSEAPRVATQLAIHFERGREFSRAIEYLIHAADNATRLYAYAEAEQHLSHALDLAAKLPAEQQAARLIALYQKRGAARFALSRFDGAVNDCTLMLDHARQTGVAQSECDALNAICQALFFSHRLEEMLPRTQQALDAAGRAGSATSRLDTMAIITLKQLCYGEVDEGRPMLDEIAGTATSIGYRPALAHALAWGGIVRFFQTEYIEAEERLMKALDLASDLRDGFVLIFCYFVLGLVRGNLGRMTEALATLNEGIERAGRNGDLFWFPRMPNCIGWIYRELQDFDQAMRYDREGLEIGQRHNVLEAQANSLINIGIDQMNSGRMQESPAAFREVEGIFARDAWFRWRYNIRLQAAHCEYQLAAGDLPRAAEYADQLRDVAARYHVRKYMAWAHKLRADIASARGDTAAAGRELTSAIELLRRFPAPLVAWKTYAALGRLRHSTGAPDDGREAFAQAAAIVQEIAAKVDDPVLRNTFLSSAAVREVLSGASAKSAT